jgi:hypothetical protein
VVLHAHELEGVQHLEHQRRPTRDEQEDGHAGAGRGCSCSPGTMPNRWSATMQ